MKIKQIVFITVISLTLLNYCTSARVITKTDNTAVIMGAHATKIEAKMEAEKEATSLFGSYKITKEEECTQEASGQADKNSASMRTYWACIIHVEKQ